MLVREVMPRRSWLARLVNWMRGREPVECTRCVGVGISKVTRMDWNPSKAASEAVCVLTVCTKCSGEGFEWRRVR